MRPTGSAIYIGLGLADVVAQGHSGQHRGCAGLSIVRNHRHILRGRLAPSTSSSRGYLTASQSTGFKVCDDVMIVKLLAPRVSAT